MEYIDKNSCLLKVMKDITRKQWEIVMGVPINYTIYRISKHGMPRRVISPLISWYDTLTEAQNALDAFAARNGLKKSK